MTSPKPSSDSGGARAAAVLLAAGRSTRMQAGGDARGARKPFLELGGRSLFELALERVAGAREVRELIVVILPEDRSRVERLLAASPAGERLRALVPGGRERVDSVRAGVRASSPDCDVVLVHDVARPFVTSEQIDAVARAAREHGAALLATRVLDTIQRSADGRFAQESLDRSQLWAAQTPQAIRREAYLEVLERALSEGFEPTDDASLYERYIGPVRLVEGSARNFKLTTPEDLELAAALVQALVQAQERR